MAMMTNQYKPYRHPLAMRLWMVLGFRYPHSHGATNDPHTILHRTVTHWNWRDRLRIMISGKTETVLVTVTDVPAIPITKTNTLAIVLAPDASRDTGQPR